MIQLSGTSNGGYCLVYNYYADESNPTSCTAPTQGKQNNGNVMGYWYQDTVQSAFSHAASYGYDGVNRLNAACTLSGSQCATSGSNVYNLAFGYDQFGNMNCTGRVGGGSAIGYCPAAWAYNSSTNQLASSTGCTYDAAGNLTKDCSTLSNHAYQWDAEGRVSKVDPSNNPPTWTFTYNALGQRVQWVSSGGTFEHMFDPSGAWLGIYGVLDVMPWGSGAFAYYTGTDTYFDHINVIGSTSIYTNHAGTAVEDVLFYPWGQNTWQSWGSGGYSFAEMPYYDTTTNTTLSLLRHYSPGLGRWLSPDPVGGDVTNPQSLNRYPYVLNNPTTLNDPLGLQPCPTGSTEFAPGQCKGDTGSSWQMWGGVGLEGGAVNGPGNCIVDGMDSSCNELYNNLHGSASLLFEVATSQALVFSTVTKSYNLSYSAINYQTDVQIKSDIDSPAFFEAQYQGGWNTPEVWLSWTEQTGTIPGGLFGAIVALLPRGYYFNPIDQAVNTHHSGQWSFRQIFHTVCSSHVTVDKTTGKPSEHVDTVNPVPAWPLLVGPGGALAVWPGATIAHWLLDVRGLFPSSEACP